MNKLERFGAGMSLLCAIHCAAMPLLVVLLPLMSSRLQASHAAEFLLIGVAASIGYITLGISFRRHGRPFPLLLLTTGLLMVWAGHAGLLRGAGTAVAVAGGLALAAAQLFNRRLAGPCACERHAHLPAGAATWSARSRQ